MSDTIAPALTPEEWATVLPHLGAGSTTPPSDHALAAVCLYGQPFCFTHDLLESLRIVEWEYSNHSSAPDAGKHAAALRTVAAIVASLLPPKP